MMPILFLIGIAVVVIVVGLFGEMLAVVFARTLEACVGSLKNRGYRKTAFAVRVLLPLVLVAIVVGSILMVYYNRIQ